MKIVLDPNATLPRRATPGSFGYDLALLSDTVVKSHETVLAPCGLQLGEDLPYSRRRGLAMMILPRSSLWKAGLIVVNAPGLIDADYAESILVLLHSVAPPAAELHAFRRNHTDRTPPSWRVQLPKGTRVAQAVFVECHFPSLRSVRYPDPRRTRGGLGSTGR